MIKSQKTLIFLGILSLFCLFFVPMVYAQENVEIQPEELGIKAPQVLPTSGVYPIKDFFRKVRLIFAFSPIKKAELRLKFANEKLMEVKELAKDEKNQELVEKTLSSYQEESERLKTETEKLSKEEKGKFTEKYVNHALKQQMVLENIASQVKGEVFEKILANRERHLKRFKEVMEKVEAKELKENIRKSIKEVVAKTPGRAIKVYETVREVEERVPEEVKEEIKTLKEEMVVKAVENIETFPLEIRETKIKEQIKLFANPLVAQEVIEEIKEKAPEIVSLPVTALPLEILQEKLAPLLETRQIEVLEKITGDRIRHLERLQEVKEKLETLPVSPVAPATLQKVIEKQLERLERKIEKIETLPQSTQSAIKEELKEAPKIKEKIMKRMPENTIIKEIKSVPLLKIPEPSSAKATEDKKETGFCGWSTKANCQADTDCFKGGCSAQVCHGKTEEPKITTCEWRDCYNADFYGVRCGCFKGKCQWE